MWTPSEITEFKTHDKIRAEGDRYSSVEGWFLGLETDPPNGGKGEYVKMYHHDQNHPIYLWVGQRTFYKWVDVQPEDTVHVLDYGPRVDESKLRLRGPGWDYDLINTPGVVAQQTTQCNVQVGQQTYVLNEGDHLRVWWEDGHLYTEFIQEV